MLRAPFLRRRIISIPPWTLDRTTSACYSSKDGGNQRHARRKREAREKEQQQKADNGRQSRDGHGSIAESHKPSLIEQLFPEETKRHEEAQRKASREVPRLPLDTAKPFNARRHPRQPAETAIPRSAESQRLYELMRREDELSQQTTVLLLRNASPNLVEEDFRRLIPQGKHMEGWTLEQGDIIKAIPGRDLATLERQNYYYLLFSSKLSAFTYQGQATRICRMASAHTPSSMTSPIPPPPGCMIDGMDAHAAIEAFALVPASQNLELRQLRPPLSPMVESIIRNQGYSSLVRRKDKMPFEVRLTLDGPQLQTSTIRFILHASGKSRALPWSGGDEIIPPIAKWEPHASISPMDHHSQRARANAWDRTEEEQALHDLSKLRQRQGKEGANGLIQEQRRTPQLVYIVGFYTEGAAQSFISYWHRRSMAWKGVDSGKDEEEDLPPVANVEMLW